MSARPVAAPVLAIALLLCAASCDASSPDPESASASPSPSDTLAPSVPPKGESTSSAAQLVWRSSPWITLAWPLDVAVAADGRVYVRDVANDSIVSLSADGYVTGSWGKLGTGEGEFDFHDEGHPHVKSTGGMVVHDDTVFVADKNRVQMFDLEGVYLGSWSSRGRGPGQLLKPTHMSVGYDGNIYVLDMTQRVVQVFTPDGEVVARWPIRVRNTHFLTTICANPDGEVFVAGEIGVVPKGGRNVVIYKFSPQGDLVRTWGRPNDGDDKADDGEFLGGTSGLACGPDGRVYVGDAGADRVQVFTSDGNYLSSVTGPPGAAPNGAIALVGDGLVATDTTSGSVSRFRVAP